MNKSISCPLTIMTIVMLGLGFAACSSDDDENEKKESQKLENTNWHSVEFNNHKTEGYFAERSESNTVVLDKMKQMHGLKYTEENKTENTDVSINLCEKSGHINDCLMNLSFNSGKCNIKTTNFQSEMKAKRTKTEKIYKFEEGSYTINWGNNNYEGINVYSYGIYRANGNLYIPLDGNGSIVVETKYEYTGIVTENINVDERSIIADYSISNNQITFNYTDNNLKKTFKGSVSADGSTITIPNNPFSIHISTFQK